MVEMKQAEKPTTYDGKNVVLAVRRKKDAETKPFEIIPYQTSLNIDFSRDSDNTATKSGNSASIAPLTMEAEVEYQASSHKTNDIMQDSVLHNVELEFLSLNQAKFNEEGKAYALNFDGYVTELSNDNDPDDKSMQDATLTIDGEPRQGWTVLPTDMKEIVGYVFHGWNAITKEDPTGGGTAWKAEDEGISYSEKPNKDDKSKEPEETK